MSAVPHFDAVNADGSQTVSRHEWAIAAGSHRFSAEIDGKTFKEVNKHGRDISRDEWGKAFGRASTSPMQVAGQFPSLATVLGNRDVPWWDRSFQNASTARIARVKEIFQSIDAAASGGVRTNNVITKADFVASLTTTKPASIWAPMTVQAAESLFEEILSIIGEQGRRGMSRAIFDKYVKQRFIEAAGAQFRSIDTNRDRRVTFGEIAGFFKAQGFDAREINMLTNKVWNHVEHRHSRRDPFEEEINFREWSDSMADVLTLHALETFLL